MYPFSYTGLRLVHKESKKIQLSKRGKQIMEYTYSLAIWFAVKSIVAPMRERGTPGEANPSQQEEVFVPFNFSALDRKLAKEAKRPVAVPASSFEAKPVAV